MRKQVLAIALSFLSAMLPLKVLAQNYEQFYIFGDSLVDNGNLFKLTGGRVPPSPPYFQGRFSNGPVWVETLGSKLEISADTNNFAFGGATSGPINALSGLVGVPLPSLPSQLNTFTSAPGAANPDALYVLWAGANDYLILPPQLRATDTQAVVNNLSNAATTLIAEGAENIIVVNLPDLGKTPQERALGTSAASTALSNSHNSNLTAALQTLAENRDVNIIPLDINALFNEALADPGRFGFTNVSDRCLGNPNCTNPDQFLFWDGIHPTAAGHRLIGEYAAAVLTGSQAVVPQADIALNIAKRQVQLIDARLVALRGVRELPSNNRWGVFLNGDLNFGEDSSDAGYDFTTTGTTAGIDYRVTENLAVGVAVGYVVNDTDLNNDLGDIEADGYAVSVYSNLVQDNFYADAVVSYGGNDFDIKRKITFDNRTATADTDGNQFSVDVNGGYNIKSGNFSYGPTVGIRYDYVDIDGYTEKGAGSLNMKVEDQQAESVVLSVGAQAAYAFNSGIGTVIPHIRASYEHEFADDSRELVTELVTQPGIPMRTTTDAPDRDYVKLGAGAQVLFSENLSGAIDYEAVIGREDVNDQVVKGEIRYQF